MFMMSVFNSLLVWLCLASLCVSIGSESCFDQPGNVLTDLGYKDVNTCQDLANIREINPRVSQVTLCAMIFIHLDKGIDDRKCPLTCSLCNTGTTVTTSTASSSTFSSSSSTASSSTKSLTSTSTATSSTTSSKTITLTTSSTGTTTSTITRSTLSTSSSATNTQTTSSITSISISSTTSTGSSSSVTSTKTTRTQTITSSSATLISSTKTFSTVTSTTFSSTTITSLTSSSSTTTSTSSSNTYTSTTTKTVSTVTSSSSTLTTRTRTYNILYVTVPGVETNLTQPRSDSSENQDLGLVDFSDFRVLIVVCVSALIILACNVYGVYKLRRKREYPLPPAPPSNEIPQQGLHGNLIALALQNPAYEDAGEANFDIFETGDETFAEFDEDERNEEEAEFEESMQALESCTAPTSLNMDLREEDCDC
eukprot:m.342303 g.342303  ORF g.342303 m.342303 type:complete len:424 (-) comp21226_c0_seq1:104-1375(-)